MQTNSFCTEWWENSCLYQLEWTGEGIYVAGTEAQYSTKTLVEVG